MHASEVLLPDGTNKDVTTYAYDPNRLWHLTWERVDQFCPSLRQDLADSVAIPEPKIIAGNAGGEHRSSGSRK